MAAHVLREPGEKRDRESFHTLMASAGSGPSGETARVIHPAPAPGLQQGFPLTEEVSVWQFPALCGSLIASRGRAPVLPPFSLSFSFLGNSCGR